MMGGTTDRCPVRPVGSCAPQGNFVAVDALVGVAKPIGRVSAYAWAGPALHSGADDTSLGAQGRRDLNAPASTHLGLGGMLRAKLLPSHGGEPLTLWAAASRSVNHRQPESYRHHDGERAAHARSPIPTWRSAVPASGDYRSLSGPWTSWPRTVSGVPPDSEGHG